MVVDLCTFSSDSFTQPFGTAGSQGLIFANNTNKIYATPGGMSFILVIDPFTNATASVTSSFIDNTVNKWAGLTIGPNGKLYAPPCYTSRFLTVDPTTNSTSMSPSSSAINCQGITLGSDNNLYASVQDDYQQSQLVINPTNNVTSGIAVPGTSWEWNAVASSNDGRIFFAPFYSNSILTINPFTNTTSLISHGVTGSGVWTTIVKANNGQMYMLPFECPTIVTVNPQTNSTSILLDCSTIPWSTGATYQAVIDDQGRSFGPPYTSSWDLMIVNDFEEPSTCDDESQGSSFNHCALSNKMEGINEMFE